MNRWKVAFFISLGFNIIIIAGIGAFLYIASQHLTIHQTDDATGATDNIPAVSDSTLRAISLTPISPEQIYQRTAAHDKAAYIIWFWWSACSPCVKNLPEVAKLGKELEDKNVETIIVDLDINTQKQCNASKRLLAMKNVDVPTYISDEPVPSHIYIDTSAATSAPYLINGDLRDNMIHYMGKVYSQFGMKFYLNDTSGTGDLLIDRNGKVIRSFSSNATADDYRVELKKMGIE